MAQRTFVISSDVKSLGILDQIFDELGAECEHSHDLAAAITRLSAEPFDAILVDCDDLQNATLIFNCLRTSSANRGAMTVALVDGMSMPTAFRLGAKTVLSKPLSLDQARNTLRTALAVQRRETELHPAKAFAAAAGMAGKSSPPITESTHAIKTEEAAATESAEVSAEPAVQKFEPISLSSGPVEPELSSSSTSGGAATAPAKSRSLESDKPHLVPPSAATQNSEEAQIHEVKKHEVKKHEVKTPAPGILDASPEVAVATSLMSPSAPDSPQKGNRGLTIALMVVLLAASSAGVWMTQPKLRNAVLWEYGKLLHNGVTQKTVPAAPAPVAVAPPAPVAPLPAAQGFQETPPPPRSVTAVAVISADPIIISEELASAHIVHNVAPWYPDPARKANLKDKVVLAVNVAADGTVQSASAQSGDPQLRLAAEEAVKQWQYQPYYQDGQAVQFQTQATVAFPPAGAAPVKP